MDFSRAKLKTLLEELSGLDDVAKREHLTALKRSDPTLHQHFRALVTSAQAAQKASRLRSDDEDLKKSVAKAAQTPRVQHVAQTLMALDGSQSKNIINHLSTLSPALSEAIKQAMFSFDDLAFADARGIQSLLASVDRKTLCSALRLASPSVVDHLMSQMSKRSEVQLKDDMEAMGKIRKRDALLAQQSITDMARKMIKAGEMVVVRPHQRDEWVD